MAVVAVAVAVALALTGAVALAVVRHHPKSVAKRPAPAPVAAAPAPSTSTTLPIPVVAGPSNNLEARFRVARSGANIELVTLASCWVQVRTGSATGPAVFTATLHHGDRRPLPDGQAVWVRIGNPPGMSIEVNGTPLPFPVPPSSQPFNLVFEPTG